MASFSKILETSSATHQGLRNSLQKYLETAEEEFQDFPSWKDLVDVNVVGDYICQFSERAQHYLFMSAECRAKRIQGEEFLRRLRKWTKHFGRENGKDLFPLIEKTEFILDKMKEVAYIFKDKHGQMQENINSLKAMSRFILD